MINFFRKIRKKMADDNKPLKYMRYAIGEIVLVVIGILIALQINNWNEKKKSDKQIELLLINLVEAINQDIDNLKFTAAVHEFRFNSFLYLLKITGSTARKYPPLPKYAEMSIWKESYPDTINREFLYQTLFYSGLTPKIAINKNVIDELKNIGLFSAITNDSLKKAVNTYYGFVDENFEQEDWNEHLTREWREFLRDNYGVLINEISTKDDIMELVKSNEPLRTRMKEMIQPAHYRSNNASKAISFAEDVLRVIKKELKI
jgi:hypothetical protein